MGTTTEKNEVINNIQIEAAKQTVYVSGLNKSVNCKAEGVDAIKSADSDYVDSKLNMDKCVNEQKKVIEDCGVECLNHSMLNKQNCFNMPDVGGCIDGTTVTFNSCIEKCKKDATNEINYWQNIYNPDLKLGNLNGLVIQYCD